jgi:lipopolysaccharide/colanic/teichoic acid biosynthesis glycosyltransferase
VIPLLPVIALAIRADSPGPVFYRQRRVGQNGREFQIIKFRSMRTDAEQNGAVWAQEGDPRVTRVGRFMRRVRIDELPQLWNVIRGDMTLVGPRPERPEFTSLLQSELPGYAHRHSVKPGLTGWAQIRYRYASSVQDTAKKLEYDLYYVRHRSLLFDIKIMFLTIPVILHMRGF